MAKRTVLGAALLLAVVVAAHHIPGHPHPHPHPAMHHLPGGAEEGLEEAVQEEKGTVNPEAFMSMGILGMIKETIPNEMAPVKPIEMPDTMVEKIPFKEIFVPEDMPAPKPILEETFIEPVKPMEQALMPEEPIKTPDMPMETPDMPVKEPEMPVEEMMVPEKMPMDAPELTMVVPDMPQEPMSAPDMPEEPMSVPDMPQEPMMAAELPSEPLMAEEPIKEMPEEPMKTPDKPMDTPEMPMSAPEEPIKSPEMAEEPMKKPEMVEELVKSPEELIKSEMPEEPMVIPEMPEEPMVIPDMPQEPMVVPDMPQEPMKSPDMPEEPMVIPDMPQEPMKSPDMPEEPMKTPEEPMETPEEPMKTPEMPQEPMKSPDMPEEPMQSPEEPMKNPEEPMENPEEPMKSPEEPMKSPEEPMKTPDSSSQAVKSPEEVSDPLSTYEGAQLLRVTATTEEQKELLDRLEEARMVDTWLRPAKGKGLVDIMVPQAMLESVKLRLADVGARFTVVIPDVQEAIAAENPAPSSSEQEELVGRKGHRMTWSSYNRLEVIHEYLDYLAQTYPDLCSVSTIGSSVEGRPLKLLRISSRKGRQAGVARPAFWIDGGIHAREWISPASVAYIIQELVENHENHGSVAEGVDWYVLPVVNPDGYEHTHQRERLWRKNRKDPHLGQCAGTDLNRNWGYKWGGAGSSRDKCKEIYAGASAFSEPETQAIRNFVTAQASSIKAYVTFHSYGQYILYPWGYDRKVPPDYMDLDRVGKKAAQAMRAAGGASYQVGNSASLLYPASGGADDWAKGGPRIKYTYTIELRDRGQYGFLLPAQFITPTAKEAFAAVKTIAQEVLKS